MRPCARSTESRWLFLRAALSWNSKHQNQRFNHRSTAVFALWSCTRCESRLRRPDDTWPCCVSTAFIWRVLVVPAGLMSLWRRRKSKDILSVCCFQSNLMDPTSHRTLELKPDTIAEWIRAGADDAARGHASPPTDSSFEREISAAREQAIRRVQSARQALERAETKSRVKLPKPLRSLRRDQEAVNEGLIDSMRSLLALQKNLLEEIESLHLKLEDVEMQLREQRSLQLGRRTSAGQPE